jgi:CheY-like chemotaxis protein
MNSKNSVKYRNVLLIDDNSVDNFVNEKLIQMHAFSDHVYACTSAQSALEFIHNLNILGNDYASIFPEVLFIDINMPVINGFQFVEFFESNSGKNLLAPKLVILTSSGSKKDKLLALEASEKVIFLNKPLTQEMLDLI